MKKLRSTIHKSRPTVVCGTDHEATQPTVLGTIDCKLPPLQQNLVVTVRTTIVGYKTVTKTFSCSQQNRHFRCHHKGSLKLSVGIGNHHNLFWPKINKNSVVVAVGSLQQWQKNVFSFFFWWSYRGGPSDRHCTIKKSSFLLFPENLYTISSIIYPI